MHEPSHYLVSCRQCHHDFYLSSISKIIDHISARNQVIIPGRQTSKGVEARRVRHQDLKILTTLRIHFKYDVVTHTVDSIVSANHLHMREVICFNDPRLIIWRLGYDANISYPNSKFWASLPTLSSFSGPAFCRRSWYTRTRGQIGM